jgi:predicted permease
MVMIETFTLLLPVFGIIALGYLLRRFGVAKHGWVKILNSFVYYVSLPALIISLFWGVELTGDTLGFFGFHTAVVIASCLLVIGVLSLFRLGGKTKITILLGAIVGNSVYMGYPILGATYPDFPIGIGMGAGTIQLIVGLLVAVCFAEYLVLRTRRPLAYVFDIAKNPLVIATAIGVALGFVPEGFASEGSIRDIVRSVISLVGETASPLALLTLGVFMHRGLSKKSVLWGGFALVSKLALFPAAVFVLSVLFGYDREATQISVLISAMPTAVTGFVLAQKYGLDENLAADIILASTVLSVLTIPAVVWMLG